MAVKPGSVVRGGVRLQQPTEFHLLLSTVHSAETKLRSMQRINLGSGEKPLTGFTNVDSRELPGTDIVSDALSYLCLLPSDSVSMIRSEHFLEHVTALDDYMVEFARVIQDYGTVEIVVPHHSCPYFYSDPTHRTFFGLYSFSYFADDGIHKRRVPQYGDSVYFELVEAKLGFKAPREFLLANAIARFLGLLLNSSRAARELYEGSLSRLIPCYELRFTLRRLPRPFDR